LGIKENNLNKNEEAKEEAIRTIRWSILCFSTGAKKYYPI
jgi:hypothetical protein